MLKYNKPPKRAPIQPVWTVADELDFKATVEEKPWGPRLVLRNTPYSPVAQTPWQERVTEASQKGEDPS